MLDHSTNGVTAYESGNRQLTLSDAIDVLRRHWRLAALCVLATVVATTIALVKRPPTYSAEVLLQRESEPSPLDNLALGSGSTSSPEELASEIEIIRTRAVLGPVVDSLGLRVEAENEATFRAVIDSFAVAPSARPGDYEIDIDNGRVTLQAGEAPGVSATAGQPLERGGLTIQTASNAKDGKIQFRVLGRQEAIKNLREDLNVEVVRGTRLIGVGYHTRDPELAADVVNAVAASYQSQAADKARRDAHRRRLFLANQFAAIADSLVRAQQSLSDYQEHSGTINPQIEGEALANELLAARNELRTVRFQESVLQSLSNSLSANGTDEGVSRLMAISQDLLPAGEVLYRRLQELEAERGRLTASRIGYTTNAAPVEIVDSLIRVAKADMRTVAAQSLRIYSARRREAEARVAELDRQVSALPARATAFVRHEQRVDAVQKTFDLLAGKYYEAQIAEAVESGDVQIVDRAAIPAAPDPKHLPRYLVLALLVGAMLGIAGAFLSENLDNSIRNVDEAERISALDVLAALPRVPSEARQSTWTSPQNAPPAVVEAFKMLRTSVRFSRTQRPKVIAVTSPGPGEGKSFTASNLAFALGQELQRVLVIDADLRRPSQQKYFDVEGGPGLSDVLIGDATFAEAVRSVHENVDLLPAGTLAPHPAELLGSSEFAAFLGIVREMYSSVVVDTPPALLAADSTIIGPLVDGVIVVARANLTDRVALRRALDQLRRSSAPLLGLVLNAADRGATYGTYGVQYGDYYPETGNGKRWSEPGATWRRWVPLIKS